MTVLFQSTATAPNPNTTVRVDECFTITLIDNPSTGFTQCLSTLPDGVSLISDCFTPSAGIGAPGKREFSFFATKVGKGNIVFNQIKNTHPKLTIGRNEIYPITIIAE